MVDKRVNNFIIVERLIGHILNGDYVGGLGRRLLACRLLSRLGGLLDVLTAQRLCIGHGFLVANHFTCLACVLLGTEKPRAVCGFTVCPSSFGSKATLFLSDCFIGKCLYGSFLFFSKRTIERYAVHRGFFPRLVSARFTHIDSRCNRVRFRTFYAVYLFICRQSIIFAVRNAGVLRESRATSQVRRIIASVCRLVD